MIKISSKNGNTLLIGLYVTQITCIPFFQTDTPRFKILTQTMEKLRPRPAYLVLESAVQKLHSAETESSHLGILRQ